MGELADGLDRIGRELLGVPRLLGAPQGRTVETYCRQHPNRQRHLMSILSSFDDQGIAGTASSVQLVYSTHSPLMVSMKRFDDIRSLSKIEAAEDLKHTSVKQSSSETAARQLETVFEADEGTFSGELTRARLELVMTP